MSQMVSVLCDNNHHHHQYCSILFVVLLSNTTKSLSIILCRYIFCNNSLYAAYSCV
ncbi:hypothetical protein BDF19DRAFT_447817, partial [Syncephalis fuscata]